MHLSSRRVGAAVVAQLAREADEEVALFLVMALEDHAVEPDVRRALVDASERSEDQELRELILEVVRDAASDDRPG